MADQRLLPPLAALRAFEAVARLGGVRRAAKELNIDHAVVSRHIRSLETWVDTQLVVRDSTGYSLTNEGETYYAEVYAALTQIANATARLIKREGDLKLSIWCIPGFAWLWLSDRLGEFIAANPDIDVDFRPADSSPDFRSKEVDGDIRYLREWEEADLPRQLHRIEIARPQVFPVASPELIARMPPIREAADLLDWPMLHEDSDAEWVHWLKAQGVSGDARLPGMRLWQAHLTLNAARQGHGVALANPMLLNDDLETGRLCRVMPEHGTFETVKFGGYTFLAREDRWNAPATFRFRRWLLRASADYFAAKV